MRIVFVCDTLSSGGAERVISSLSNEFAYKGHNITIILLSKVASRPFYQLDKRIRLIFLTTDFDKKPSFLKKSRLLKQTLINIRPDFVISFLSYVCIYTWWALKSTKIPYFVSERNDPNKRSKLKQFLLNCSFKKAAGCVFQTEDAMNYYGFIKPNKKTIIYNPVNSLVSCNTKKVSSKKVILSVGRLEEQKNPFLLIDAFNIFNKTHNDYVLKMYGSGSLKNELETYICDNNIQNVVLCGNSKTWQQDEFNARVFALSSNYEGMPNSLLEALCLGIPSVSTDCPIGGPKEVKKVFGDGLILTKCGDATAFANAIEQCIKMKRKKVFIPEVFETKNVANQWLTFIKERI